METNLTKANEKPHARAYTPEEIDKLPGREIAEKRTVNSKVFSLGGNLYQSILYADPVHYQDKETGQWREIDNTLVVDPSIKDETALVNKDNGNLRVRLSNSSDEQMVVLENSNGQTLSWSLENAETVSPRVMENSEQPAGEQDQRRKVLEKVEGKAIYEDVLFDTNIICKAMPEGFKDEIVFKSLQAVKPVSFLLCTPGLQLAQKDNGAVEFVTPSGEPAFHLPAPFMTDLSPGREVGVVNSTLQRVEGNGVWRLTYTPDMDWISGATFPVMLDPLVYTVQHSSAIEDNYVTSEYPSTVQSYSSSYMRVTYNSGNWGNSKAFIRFLDASLPSIDSSYYVTKAHFSIALRYGPTSSASVYLKEVLGDWSSQTITYNNMPAASSMPLDYEYIPYGASSGTRYTYDISNLVRKWYAGSNYGIMLEANTSTYMELYSSDYAYAKPYVAINYVSLAGVEDYLSYETQSVGRAGTGHVSLYNGNLIFKHQDSTCNGNLLPLSVSHVYNSCYKNTDAFHLGYGWKHSLQQTLHKETIDSEVYYVYTTDDGTRHHFKKPTTASTYYEDLSGLSMKLTISGSVVTIKDKGNNTMTFALPTVDFADNYANVKMLTSIQDAQGTTATLSTSGTNMTNAADGAARNTTFTITSGRLSQINAPGYSTNGVSFAYNGSGQLTQITHEDGEVTTYTYNAYGLLATATNHDGLKVTYDYYTTREPYRVRQVTISNGTTVGNSRLYEYGDCLTTITDLTVANGKKLFYHFNDYGNVVSVNDQLGYAAFAKYSDSLPVNHPEVVSKMQRAVCNLLPNHNFEESSSWNTISYDGTGTYTYATDQKYMGLYSMKVDKTNTDGNMCVYMDYTSLEVGKTYTLSGYIRSTGSAYCYATVYCSGWYDGDKVTSIGEWTRIFTTFTATTTNATLYFITMGGPGTVWIDCAQLEESPVANSYNMLINGDFSFNSGAHPTGWLANATNTASDIVYTTYDGVKPDGLTANTMRLYGTGRTKYAGIYQDIPQSGSEGDVYIAGGWSMNHSKPRKGEDYRYNIRVAFLQSGTSTRVNTPSIEWSEEWSEWQFASGPVVAPCNYTSIRFNVDYERNINYTEFDGFFLHKEEFGQTYAYDENNNITSVKNLASQQSYATYDDFDNMLTYRQPGRAAGVQTTLEYGTTDAQKQKHLLLKSTDPVGVINTFTHDSKGNQTSTQTENSTASSFIKGTTAYTANQNYVASQTDARAKTITSNIDLTKGTLDSVTDPNSQTVNYTYDTLKRITGATATADSKTYRNEYAYTDDKLTQVKHNTTSNTTSDVVYNFAYDDLGNPTTVQIGTQTLSTNVYTTTGDKLLSQVNYGNGGSVQYIRDDFKRVTGIRYDGAASDVFQYTYGANGQVAQIKDAVLSRTATHEYDLANRLMRIKHMSGTNHLYTSTLGYDTYNNLSSFKEKIGSTDFETSYSYDNGNRPTTVQYGSTNNKVAYAYDDLGRISTRTTTAGGTAYTSTFGYTAGGHGTGSTTALVSSIAQANHPYTYTYDDVGNIASETHNGYTTSYAYDNLGQLVRANDQRANETWVFSYDRGGNLLEQKRYDYTTGTPATLQFTDTYEYTDTWKDLMTKRLYGGWYNMPITYDNIGNMTSYAGWVYTWSAGRQLVRQVQGTSRDVQYKYNDQGIRVQKIYNGTTTDYTLQGKKIVHMKVGTSRDFHFFYDAQGSPAVVRYNNNYYQYVKNLQGDIIAILDSSGTQVVEYTYDPWGQKKTVTGTMAGSLGAYNPFRYRGYVFDEETQMYYLNSRYYYPELRRFINADSTLGKPGQLFAHNVFVYCKNRPVNMVDHNGSSPVRPPGMPTSDWLKYYAYLKGHTDPMMNGKKQHPTESYSRIPSWILITASMQEIRAGFRYPTKGESHCAWGLVDCISVARFIGIHFHAQDYAKFDTTTRNLNRRDMIPIDDIGIDNIPEAYGVAHWDSDHYDHVGVYVGSVYFDGTWYTHGVVSSPSAGELVHITELDPSYWTDVYKIPFVDYPD